MKWLVTNLWRNLAAIIDGQSFTFYMHAEYRFKRSFKTHTFLYHVYTMLLVYT